MTSTINHKYDENKILFSNYLFKWMKYFSDQRDTIVISPLTKLSDLIDLKKGSPLFLDLLSYNSEGVEKYLNLELISSVINHINNELKSEILTIDLSSDKVIKALFMLSESVVLSSKILLSYLKYLDRFLTKIHTVVLIGFDDIKIDSVFTMLNVHVLTNYLPNLVNWSNVESLVFLDYAELHEITDRERLKAYLELKTRTVLSLKDLEDYFSGRTTFNSFMIEVALRELK